MATLPARVLGICGWLLIVADGAYAQTTDATLEARAVAHAERTASSVSWDANAARHAAGTAGEPVLALADLPGVARAGFASGELIVWGSPTADTRIYVDGIEVPVLFHPGGFRSVIHPALISRLTLTAGAPAPEFGRGLGGVVELDTRELDGHGDHAAVTLDTIDSSVLLQGELGPVRAAWALRVGYLDRLAPLVATRAGEIVPLPAYADGFAKAQADLGQRAALTAVWLGTHDQLQRGFSSIDPTSSRTATQARDFQLGYLRYERVFGDGARIAITPFVTSHAARETSSNAGVPWSLDARELRYGMRASYELASDNTNLRLGVDSSAVHSRLTRNGTLTLPPREGDVAVFAQPPGNEVTRDDWSTYDANIAPYASLGLRLGRWTLSPGLRLDVQALSSSRARPTIASTPAIGFADLQVHPEPRASVRYRVADFLSLDAGAGITHQAAAAADRSAVSGNPALGLARAASVAGGPRAQLSPALRVEVTAFYKALTGLPARNPAQPPPLAEALLPNGTGESYGAELLVRLATWHGFSAQLAYTLSRALRRDADAAERLFDFDQTHVASILGAYSHAGWIFGSRARVASGSPRTAVVATYRDLHDDRYEPIFGPHNGVRLPAFFALDLRIERAFIERGFAWSVSLDLLNVTNHRNVEDIAYRFDYQEREDITGLPVLAVLGLHLRL